MSTNEKEVEKTLTFNSINHSIAKITGAGVQTAIAETQSGRIEQVVEIYAAVKPLLVALSTIALIPGSWRAGITLFVSALDALAVTVSPDFKAGKDL